MAAQDESRGAATGVDQGELKRRNVAGQANGSYVPKEAEQKMDEKSKQKVRRCTCSDSHQAVGHEWVSVRTVLTEVTMIDQLLPSSPRRLRVPHCASHLHRPSLLHPHVEDWPLAYRHVG